MKKFAEFDSSQGCIKLACEVVDQADVKNNWNNLPRLRFYSSNL